MNSNRLHILLLGPILMLAELAACPAKAQQPEIPRLGAKWEYTRGDCELAEYYAWAESGKSLPSIDRQSRSDALIEKGLFLEAFLWATAEKSRSETTDPLLASILDALTAPLENWERLLKIEVPPTRWHLRAEEVARRLNLQFGRQESPGTYSAARLPLRDQLRLAEILLVAAVDHIEPTRAESILRHLYQRQPTYETFCRWRAYAHHTRLDDALLEYEEATSSTLPYPEALEDLAIERLRRRHEADAFPYLLALFDDYPDRWPSHASAIRASYKARLAKLCEWGRFDEAMAHLQIGARFPFEVLDPDMATYAIYYRLMQDQNEHPSQERQALIKFMMNHSIFAVASYVSQALEDRNLAANLPQAYRAIVEAQLGNVGMTYRALEAAVREEPPSPAFFFALGLATERFKNLWTLAERCYSQSLELDSEYEPSLLALARHSVMKGDFDSALQHTQTVLSKHPQNDLARYETARVNYVRGDLEGAEPILEELASSLRCRPDYFYFLVEIALRRNDMARAREWIRALLRQYPNDIRAYLLLADCARAEENTEAEAAALEVAYGIARPWRFDRMEAARLYRLASDRLARLNARHACAPRVHVQSVRRNATEPLPPTEIQSASPWTLPPRSDSVRVFAKNPPRWLVFDKEWSRSLNPIVWRDLIGGVDPWEACVNELMLHNPSEHEMLAVRIFADDREFAFQYRVVPNSTLRLKFKTARFPRRIGLVYTTDTGFEQTVLPECLFARAVDPTFIE